MDSNKEESNDESGALRLLADTEVQCYHSSNGTTNYGNNGSIGALRHLSGDNYESTVNGAKPLPSHFSMRGCQCSDKGDRTKGAEENNFRLLNDDTQNEAVTPPTSPKRKTKPLATIVEKHCQPRIEQDGDMDNGDTLGGCDVPVAGDVRKKKASKEKINPLSPKLKSPSTKSKTTVKKKTTGGSLPKSPVRPGPKMNSSSCLLAGNAATAAFLDQLKDANASKWDIHLPAIVVVGETSAGKSSVLSALCQLELPKSRSFTTRCPIRITMKQSNMKHASVSVQWRSNIVENQYPDFSVCAIKDWDTIPRAIAEAQAFILEHTQKQVTNDVILVKVKGPEYMHLTVVDLPGIVRSKPGEEETLRTDVTKIHHEFLIHQRSLILAIHPTNSDWHNSQIVLSMDPKHERTIFCLTKPDLLEPGTESEALDLLKGEKLKFRQVHIVKCRGQSELDEGSTSIIDGLAREKSFFENTEPWRYSLPDRSIVGTENLRARLGALQMEMVRRETLPARYEQVSDRKKTAVSRLAKMGARHRTDQDRYEYLQERYESIVNAVQQSVSGEKSPNATGQTVAACLHADCAQFRERIFKGTLATLRKVDEGHSVIVAGRDRCISGEVVHVEEDSFACVDFIQEEDRSNSLLLDHSGMQAPQDIEENDVWVADDRVFIARQNNVYDVMRKIPLSHIRRDPSWLKPRLASQKTDNLACFFLSPRLFNSIVVELIELEWEPHAIRMIDLLHSTSTQLVTDAVARSFAGDTRYKKDLSAWITQRCVCVVNELVDQAREQVMSHIAMEKHPYTQDVDFFAQLALGREIGLKQELTAALSLAAPSESPLTIVQEVFQRQEQKKEEDQAVEDLENMLQSYGTIAARRFLDRTPMVCWQLYRRLPTALAQAFETEQMTSSDVVVMEENPKYLAKLKTLTEEVKELEGTLRIFDDLLLKTSSS